MEIAAEVWSWLGPKATETARFGGELRRRSACVTAMRHNPAYAIMQPIARTIRVGKLLQRSRDADRTASAPAGSGYRQGDDFGPQGLGRDVQVRERDGQPKPAWAGAARI